MTDFALFATEPIAAPHQRPPEHVYVTEDAEAMINVVRRAWEPEPTDAVIDACREALSERCGYMLIRFGPNNSIPCTRDTGHAGEHGV